MKNKKMIAIFGVMVIMLLFSILAIKSDSSTIETSVNITLSNKKIGWGIKRNDNHEQPDLGANNKKLIDKTY